MNENLKSLYESLETRKKLNPANYYVPNGKIEEFIKIVGKGTFISALIAGNGVGKSCAGVNIIANLIFDDVKNKYFDYPIFRKFPFSEKRGRIISDPTTIQQTLIPELKKWFPLNKYVTSKAGKGYEYNWMTNSNHKFDILTYEQEIKEFESATLSWVWFDEPPPLAIYKASIARLRTDDSPAFFHAFKNSVFSTVNACESPPPPYKTAGKKPFSRRRVVFFPKISRFVAVS